MRYGFGLVVFIVLMAGCGREQESRPLTLTIGGRPVRPKGEISGPGGGGGVRTIDSGARIADVNGDGLPDIIRGQFQNYFDAYLNTGSGWSQSTVWVPPLAFATSTGLDTGTRIVDVNGDGLPEVIRSQDGWGQKAYRNTGTGWVQDNTWIPPVAVPFASNLGTDLGTRIVDVDGDGLQDIIRNQVGWGQTAYRNMGAGWVLDNTWLPPVSVPFASSTGTDLGTRIVDVNGDGLPDIIRSQVSWGQLAYRNTGSGWVQDNTWLPPVAVPFVSSTGTDLGTRIVDVNGDGLPDIIRSQTGWGAVVYLNTGAGWSSTTLWMPPIAFVGATGQDFGIRFADVNNDGFLDLLQSWANSWNRTFLNIGNGWQVDSTWAPPAPFVY